MSGCGKVLVIDFDKLSQRGGKQFSFPSLKGGKLERKIFAPTLKGVIFLNCKGRKIVWGNCSLLVVTSALKSQRRVRCEFSVICFLEIGCLLREIN